MRNLRLREIKQHGRQPWCGLPLPHMSDILLPDTCLIGWQSPSRCPSKLLPNKTWPQGLYLLLIINLDFSNLGISLVSLLPLQHPVHVKLIQVMSTEHHAKHCA